MIDEPSLDPVTILTALGMTTATVIEPVTGGWDTMLWRVADGRDVYALRVFRAEQAKTCRREVVAMGVAASGGIPVPHVQSETVWQGRPALLLSWCAGRPLLEELRARPWRAWLLGVAFGQLQARIHRLVAPDGWDGDAWIGWAGPDEAPLQMRLREVAAVTPRRVLLHLDYHPLNVLTDGHRITAVLDWANARSGDPRADLARTLTILRLAPFNSGGVWLWVERRLLEWGWRRGYQRIAGWPRGMVLFYAWAGAVMVRDLAPKLGRPGIPLLPHHLDPVRAWTARWKHRAGLPVTTDR